MKKIIVGLLAALLFYASSFGQKGTTFIGAGADLVIPTGTSADYLRTGFGVYAKALFGVGTAGQVTFTGGYAGFKTVIPEEIVHTRGSLVPLLIGYRHNFNGFFVEPQLGYSVFGAKITDGDDYYSDSQGGFMWAAGIGYVFNNKIEVGARYESTSKEGETDPFFGLRLGYNFSVKSSNKK